MTPADTIEIRRVETNEAEALQEISRRTFSESFAAANTAENMRAYLETNLALDRIRQELKSGGSEFYFMLLSGRVVAYLKLNFGKTHAGLSGAQDMEIERIYLLKEYQGTGRGQQLLQTALDKARAANCKTVWLGVWEHNKRAIAFYLKNGFAEIGKHPFMLGDDEQTDLLMQLNLSND